MQPLERASILLALSEALRNRGSWTGETHIQKASYFLQRLLGVSLELDFILYKHGPYSFDLTNELAGMQADGFLALQPRPFPYGPSYVPGPLSGLLKTSYGRIATFYEPQVQFAAQKLGARSVAELERLATALYVSFEGGPPEDRPTRINALKPHVSVAEAAKALAELDQICCDAKGLNLLTAGATL